MIIKKKQLFIDAPCIVGGRKETQPENERSFDPTEILQKAEKKAQEIVEEAKREAEKILMEAREKQQKVLQEIEVERQQIKKRSQEVSQRLNVLVSNFERQLEKKKQEISDQLIDALRILIEKLTFRYLDETDFSEKMKKLFSKLSELKRAKVFMSQQDAENFPEIVKQCEELGFDVVKSTTLKPGEVLVETDLGVLDGTKRAATMLVEKLIEEVFGSARTN
ncbi:MAG: FliH/SctL family protein [Pseudothermotoga sp.]|nr:FliH/SctL family protein [Pseudothermotoga sp.]